MVDWPFADLIPHSYRVIICDPAWTWKPYSDKGLGKSPQGHYACMDLAAIQALPVADLAHPTGCTLLLWATAPMMPEALATMAAWSFEYKSMAAWAKQSSTGRKWAFGTGYIFRSAAEFLLVGTRGKPHQNAHNVRNLLVAPVREHSRKPDLVYAIAESLWDGPRCDLFSRQTRDSWTPWGHEVGKFAEKQNCFSFAAE
jgi:N6-adenosine-specific RNA methylase IME4